MRRLPCSWRVWRLPWSCRCIASSASISRSPSCRVGTLPFSRPTLSPAPSTPASPWSSPCHSDSHVLPPGRPHHHPPHRQHGQGDVGHRLDRRLRLWHGNLHGLVLRQPLGILHDVEPHVRSHGLVLLGADHLQHRPSAIVMAAQHSRQPGQDVHHVADHQCGHVVRALCHHCDQSLPRLPAVFLGNLRATRWDYATFIGTWGCLLRSSFSSSASCP